MKGRESSNVRSVRLDALEAVQTRAATDADAVAEYAEAMASGAKFPPIEVREVEEGGGVRLIVTDGIHRMEAARRNGADCISARVLPGSLASAYRDALAANAGLRRTNADKRHALAVAWEYRRIIWPRDDGADPSAEVLARACLVSLRTAQSFMAEIQPTQIAQVDRPQPTQIAQVGAQAPRTNCEVADVPKMPTRKVFGADGRVRPVPPKMPTRPASVEAGFGARRVAGHVVPVDRYGAEIPVEIQGVFTVEAEDELRGLLAHVSAARVALRKGHDGRNPWFAAIRQDALVMLNNAYNFVGAGFPHCVCRACQGQGCKACHERGWQTEDEYKRNPKELQAEGSAA